MAVEQDAEQLVASFERNSMLPHALSKKLKAMQPPVQRLRSQGRAPAPAPSGQPSGHSPPLSGQRNEQDVAEQPVSISSVDSFRQWLSSLQQLEKDKSDEAVTSLVHKVQQCNEICEQLINKVCLLLYQVTTSRYCGFLEASDTSQALLLNLF